MISHPDLAQGLPPVARRRRGPDRGDRLHGRLVHRLLRANPRRAARRRGLVGAVEAGWERAMRTIYISKGVNMLSAVVLYILAVGSVKGFAFTLGLTAVIDVLDLRAVHAPGDAAARDHPVLLERPPAVRPRPERARRGLPRPRGVPHVDRGAPRRCQPRGRASSDDRRAQGGRAAAAIAERQGGARPPRPPARRPAGIRRSRRRGSADGAA